MILRLMFVMGLVAGIFWLVRRHYLSLDFAWLLFLMLAVVLGVSLSPTVVESLAHVFDFGTPAMAVVALAIAALIGICLVLALEITALKKQNALLLRKIASLELHKGASEQWLDLNWSNDIGDD
jgi:hypothetical protein